jgi:hypothetical protein
MPVNLHVMIDIFVVVMVVLIVLNRVVIGFDHNIEIQVLLLSLKIQLIRI